MYVDGGIFGYYLKLVEFYICCMFIFFFNFSLVLNGWIKVKEFRIYLGSKFYKGEYEKEFFEEGFIRDKWFSNLFYYCNV